MMNKLFKAISDRLSNAQGRPSPHVPEGMVDAPRECLALSVDGKQTTDSDYNQYIWESAGELREDPDIQSLIQHYEQDIRRDACIKATTQAPFRLRDFFAHGWGRPAAALAAPCVILAVAYVLFSTPAEILYETRTGVQKTVTLADNSTVNLNTDSAVRVVYDAGERNIFLDRGEAYFAVEKDTDRPFNVHTRAGIVRAIGTEFNIFIDENPQGKVVVSVIEGKVSIKKEGDGIPRIILPLLEPGEAVALNNEVEPDDIRPADLVRISGWRQGQIIFRDINLDDAIRDHNRYSEVQIILKDKSLGRRKISGTFKIGDTEALMFALEHLLDIQIERENKTLVISRQTV